MAKPGKMAAVKPRERLIAAAYELFAVDGISQVGIDTILAKSGCAKASLYGNFSSKVGLAVAFLEQRERMWTRGWLVAEIDRRGSTPDEKLLAIFDALDGWFRKRAFEGCSFIKALLESRGASSVHRAAARQLAKIRAFLCGLAREAGLRDPEEFAQIWQMLMSGSIVAASGGNRDAARQLKRAARIVIAGWARRCRR